MIAGLDSSFDRPTPAQAAAAFAAGVRVWGGYIGTRGGLGLATLWSQADFDVVRGAGMTAIGFCSGWDDPVGIRDLAAAWGVLPSVDVEPRIRDDGPWVQGWLDASGAGLYGLASVHNGRTAAFHIMAWYGSTPPACWDPGATWPSWLARPNGPLGWQFCGTHNEFGLSVDRGWYDDWFNAPPPPPPKPKEDVMVIRNTDDGAVYQVGEGGKRHIGPLEYAAVLALGLPVGPVTTLTVQEIRDVGVPPAVDVNVLATALATHPLTATLSDAERDAIATHVLQHLSKDTAAG